MEENDSANIGLISCIRFVKRGVAKAVPEKVQLTEKELQDIIKQTAEDLRITENDENSDSENEAETMEQEQAVNPANPNDEFDFENYDRDEVNPASLLGIGTIATFENDENISGVNMRNDEPDSEEEDDIIKTSDNLILVGHCQGDASVLEVYVYNEAEGSLYVHHDFLLPSFPLCIEWLNRDPSNNLPGNLCAIGTMDPVIQIWDLDILDCLEPAFKLGKKKNKKKNIKGVGHKDAVLDLAWNSNFDHILASGSVDQTVLLWDIDQGEPHTKLKYFQEKVQSIQWHPLESQSLLSGCCDFKARISDCRTTDAVKEWAFDAEVEKVTWDVLKPFCFAVSLTNGQVSYVDCRTEQSLWSIKAHDTEVTGLSLSYQCPGLMVTLSSDGSMKSWDISQSTPELVSEKSLGIGAAQTLSVCPENPFVFSAGGDNKSKNFGVWDITKMDVVRDRFASRQLVTMTVN